MYAVLYVTYKTFAELIATVCICAHAHLFWSVTNSYYL